MFRYYCINARGFIMIKYVCVCEMLLAYPFKIIIIIIVVVALDPSKSVVQAVAFELIVEVGQLLQEALVGVNIAVHTNSADCFGCRHLA
jgi:hypothetical protein